MHYIPGLDYQLCWNDWWIDEDSYLVQKKYSRMGRHQKCLFVQLSFEIMCLHTKARVTAYFRYVYIQLLQYNSWGECEQAPH